MAAQIIAFPRPTASQPAPPDLHDALRSFSALEKDARKRVHHAINDILREEYEAVLRRAGVICPGDLEV